MAPHLALLNRYLVEVAARRIRFLIITMLPRHGKSMFVSEYFPDWWLGTFPRERIILASYEAGFASTWGRKARDALEAHGQEVFGVRARPENGI